jgi:anaerobic magnesium-protoporphyrin IX monomethyl ester cyclase
LLTVHITLIRPPIFSSTNSFSSPVTPPLALAYLSASLRSENFSVESIDAVGEAIDEMYPFKKPEGHVRGLSIEKILQRIPRETDLIGISCMFSQEWPFVKYLVNSITSKFPDITVILGGEHITALPEFVLESCPNVSICAIGEGEETIVDIARNYPEHVENIDGILYRAENGKIFRTTPRKRICNIEEIPRPDWENIQIEPYLNTGYRIGINSGRAMPILATRGCPYQCTFCSNEQMWGLNYYTRSPRDVVDEIEEYIHKYQIDSVDFYDLTAIIKKDWILEFGTLLKNLKTNISWSLPSGTRSEALDPEVTRLMAETNCKYLVYAAESGSPKVLRYIKKKVNLNNMMNSMKEAKKNGLSLRCNLMLGFPTEDRVDIFKTMIFQLRLSIIGVDDAPLYMFSPYPGTELFEYLLKKKRIKAIDDEYFRSLLCQMDLLKSSEFCEKIGPKELAFYRFIGMGTFYTLSYLLYPGRIVRSIKNIFFSQKTDTVFEQRVAEYFKTKKIYS